MAAWLPVKPRGAADVALFVAAALLVLFVALPDTARAATRPETKGPFTFTITREGKTVVKESQRYPSPFTDKPEIFKGDLLGLAFGLKDSDAVTDKSKDIPHQVFILLTNALDTDLTVVRHIPRTAVGSYKLSLDTRNFPSKIFANPGEYNVEIALGGFQYEEGLIYKLGSVQVSVLDSSDVPPRNPPAYGPLPEIHHQFRGSMKMVAPFVSYIFVAVVLCPWLWLLALWRYLGVNLNQFPRNFSSMAPAVGFMLSLCGILIVIFCYWISVTLGPTLIYLFSLSLLAAVSGRQTLANMARQRLGS